MKELLIAQSWRLINSFIKFYYIFCSKNYGIKIVQKKNLWQYFQSVATIFKSSDKYYVYILVK